MNATAPNLVPFKPRKSAKRPRRSLSSCLALAGLSSLAITGAGLGLLLYRRPLRVLDEIILARLKMAGFESQFVTVGGHPVHYFVGGKGRPLLLIHGLGSRSQNWALQMMEYAKQGFRVYAIDLLGCGRTAHPDIAYSIREQAGLIHGFLDALHIERLDVAGWSMGGWVALTFLIAHPGRVRRLVLMDSAGIEFSTDLGPEVFPPHSIPELKRLMARLTPFANRLPGFVERDLLRIMQRNHGVVRRAAASMLSGNDLLDDRLNRVTVPVLIIWGERDALIPLEVGLRMHNAIQQSVLVVYSQFGHLAPVVCARRIARRVTDFLGSETAPTGGIEHF